MTNEEASSQLPFQMAESVLEDNEQSQVHLLIVRMNIQFQHTGVHFFRIFYASKKRHNSRRCK